MTVWSPEQADEFFWRRNAVIACVLWLVMLQTGCTRRACGLGHTTVAMTLDTYSHVTDTIQAAAA